MLNDMFDILSIAFCAIYTVYNIFEREIIPAIIWATLLIFCIYVFIT